jgi:hypothetical protein
MKRISILLAVSLGFGSVAMAAPDAKKAPPAKAPAGKKAPPPKAPPPKKIVPVSAEKKKVLAELYGGFKFGMTKDEVLKVLSKQIDERYEEKIKATEDITKKDKLRSEKKRELSDVQKSYVEFNGKNVGGWDVSIIEGDRARSRVADIREVRRQVDRLGRLDHRRRVRPQDRRSDARPLGEQGWQEPAPLLLLRRRQALEDGDLRRRLHPPRGQAQLRNVLAGDDQQVRPR